MDNIKEIEVIKVYARDNCYEWRLRNGDVIYFESDGSKKHFPIVEYKEGVINDKINVFSFGVT